jgi:hypothetical protein
MDGERRGRSFWKMQKSKKPAWRSGLFDANAGDYLMPHADFGGDVHNVARATNKWKH